MRKTHLAILIGPVIFLAACSRQPAPEVDAARLQAFAPLPETVAVKTGEINDEMVSLGRMLFYENRLSRDQTVSCNSCHDLANYGVDGRPTSDGHKGQRGDRNSPTVYNAAAHFAQFWDGRAPTVEEQAKGPVMNPVEMAMPAEKQVVKVLKSMPGYVAAFRVAFPKDKDPVTFDNMARAIGAFERRLMTPSRWDRFLRGDRNAITAEEKQGFIAFTSAGCQTCHSGALVGGNMYQKLGLMRVYPDQSDPGRAKVTKNDGDKGFFKVPSLRNVEKTGPYFHNGKVPALETAVSQMAEYQLGRQLSEQEIRSIVTWLKTLTGDIPSEYIKKPELPPGTASTPKPDTV